MFAPLLVVIAVAVVYMQTLGAPFLWDDRMLIVDAPKVEAGASLLDFLRSPFWAGADGTASLAYYRPLVVLSFALDHRLHQGNPGGFHLTNLVLHLANAVMLYALVRRAGARELTAGLVVGAWALMPRLAEATAWISGRTDLLSAFFGFAALLAWRETLGRRALAALLFTLGLLSKESALGVLVGLAWVEWTRATASSRGRRLLRTLERLAPVVVAVAVYVALRVSAVGLLPGTRGRGVGAQLAMSLEALGTYAWMLVDVFRPRAVIGRPGLFEPLPIALGVFALLATVYGLVKARSLSAERKLGLGLALGALLPVLHLVPIPLRTLAADRFLYLPLAGLAIGCGPALEPLLLRLAWLRLAVLALVVALGVRCYTRAAVWSDEIAFWTHTFRETPNTSNVAAIELGAVFLRAGDFAGALAVNQRAVRYDDPHQSNARFNAALCLARLGHSSAARQQFERFSRELPKKFGRDAARELALLDARDGRLDAAFGRLERPPLRGDPESKKIAGRLRVLEAERRRAESAQGFSAQLGRSRVAEGLGARSEAAVAALRVIADESAPKPAVREAVQRLVRVASLSALVEGVARFRSRFGELDPPTLEYFELRRAELERLARVRAELGI